MRNTLTLFSLFFAALSVNAGGWYVEGGAICRKSLKLDMSSDAYARQLGLQAAAAFDNKPTLSWTYSDSLAAGSRTFDDGHVLTDASSALFGNTENWSFNSMSQYSSANNTLTYHLTALGSVQGDGVRQTVTTYKSETTYGDDTDGSVGASVRTGYVFLERDSFWASLQLGLNVYDRMTASLNSTPYAQTVTTENYRDTLSVEEHWTYVYDADFGGAPLVAVRGDGTTGAPYLPVTPTGSTLDSHAGSTSSSVLSSSSQTAASRVNLGSDLQLSQLDLGPRFGWDINRRFSVGLWTYLSVNLIDFSATRSENFRLDDGTSLGTWFDSSSKTTVAGGGGGELSLTFNMTARIYLTVHGGYDAIIDAPDLNVGPSKVKADLDSWTCGALVGVRL